MNAVLNAFVKLFIRVFLPGIAKSLEEEGQFDFRDRVAGQREIDLSRYLDMEDNGSDITLICFAGMAVLYAAMPKFEFRNTLVNAGGSYNFIWVRDVHRSCYNFPPDGSPSGYAFYTRIIGDALARLKSSRNVAVGASGGGAAAFAFSGVLPMDLIVTFNPAFPLKDYCSAENTRRVLLDWKKLLFSPRDYFEVVLVTLSVHYLWRRNCRLVGEQNVIDSLASYQQKDPPAPAVVFYSDHALPDARQAMSLKDVPTITLKPVDSGRHNCMGELRQRGELGACIRDEILKWLERP